ncbi:MAG: hypothetical protein CMC38_05180 [Flavobacteriaceae bacterium]|nr:hypothetical protein [Flavobacteriaceae bacterium]|tara:strand:- start:2992 stop:4590 length:1599 start_codon:yes stop_codon:yes gene_type:complete
MKKFKFFFIISLLFFSQCAKRGMPEGGPKDEDPPILITAIPEKNSINFKEKKIRLFFDEYIRLKDFRKQLVVSPPIEKSLYTISPQSGASKYIQIDINKTLPQNTTYVFNFGQSVVDNNEGNILPYFKYVFSTGDYIDSLKISGNIKNAFKRESDNFITALLYPVNDSYTDSIVYNNLPTYVGSTLDSTNFEISNLKKGKYLLIALNDFNNNYKFDPETEEIGFINKYIDVPSSNDISINLFKEELIFKSFKPFIETNNKISFGFKGNYEDVKIELLDSFSNNFKSTITKNKETDTLNYWFENIKYDSLRFVVKKNSKKDFFTVKYKEKEKDSLILIPSESGTLNLNDKFKLYSNIPITNVNSDFISLLNNDSVSLEFNSKIDKNKFDIIFDFEVLPNDKYILSLLPNAITDFLGSTNDTISYEFSTRSRSDYGTIKLKVQNERSYPIIVQLTDSQEKIVREKILYSIGDPCVFTNLSPAKYFIRTIIDENKNKKWDTGSFLKKIEPEKTFHFDEELDVRANWILEEKLIIN